MITTRTAKQRGQIDYGWSQARYTFSFGHYSDPKLSGYVSLRVLNQEILAPGVSFQPRIYLKVDIINLILEGEAEYRDSEGNHIKAKAGEVLLLATQLGTSYSEHNISKDKPLTRMQFWLDTRPQREDACVQKATLGIGKHQLLASPDSEQGSLYPRQQVWVYHVELQQGELLSFQSYGPRACLQSIHGRFHAATSGAEKEALTRGDGTSICDEINITSVTDISLCALLIDSPIQSGKIMEHDY